MQKKLESLEKSREVARRHWDSKKSMLDVVQREARRTLEPYEIRTQNAEKEYRVTCRKRDDCKDDKGAMLSIMEYFGEDAEDADKPILFVPEFEDWDDVEELILNGPLKGVFSVTETHVVVKVEEFWPRDLAEKIGDPYF